MQEYFTQFLVYLKVEFGKLWSVGIFSSPSEQQDRTYLWYQDSAVISIPGIQYRRRRPSSLEGNRVHLLVRKP